MSDTSLFLQYLDVLVWPATVVILSLAYRSQITALLQRSTIKLTLYGFEVTTTLDELGATTLATLGGYLDDQQSELLEALKEGPIRYDEPGVPRRDREWVRPVMNAGLIMTMPRNSHLGEADGLALTPLGGLLTRGKAKATAVAPSVPKL